MAVTLRACSTSAISKYAHCTQTRPHSTRTRIAGVTHSMRCFGTAAWTCMLLPLHVSGTQQQPLLSFKSLFSLSAPSTSACPLACAIPPQRYVSSKRAAQLQRCCTCNSALLLAHAVLPRQLATQLQHSRALRMSPANAADRHTPSSHHAASTTDNIMTQGAAEPAAAVTAAHHLPRPCNRTTAALPNTPER